MGTVLERLAAAGISLPAPNAPAANYLPSRRSGDLLFVAGQTPVSDGRAVHTGIVGRDLTVADGKAAARLCALNILAQVAAAVAGDLERVACVRLTGFVRCDDDFALQAEVMDGASDLLVLALGERGRHVRTSVGTNALPRKVPVEIDAIFEVDRPL